MSTATLIDLDTTALDDSFDVDVQVDQILSDSVETQSISCTWPVTSICCCH